MDEINQIFLDCFGMCLFFPNIAVSIGPPSPQHKYRGFHPMIKIVKLLMNSERCESHFSLCCLLNFELL